MTKKRKTPNEPIQRRSRFFQGLPVREARGDILVQPNQLDLDIATRNDPQNCAYACCIRRMLGTRRVFVYSAVAYVEALDETGRSVLERYMIKDHAHAYIQKFDRGEKVNPAGFILHRPRGSKTLEYKRRQSRQWAINHHEQIKEWGRKAWQKKQAKKMANWKAPELKHELIGSFRDGTGQVKFLGTHEGLLKVRTS